MPITRTIDNAKAERVRRVADLASRRSRERYGRFLIEGPQAVREAVSCRPDTVLDLYAEIRDMEDGVPHDDATPPRFANDTIAAIVSRAEQEGVYVHPATAAVMRRISPDCQGIAAVGDLERMQTDVQDVRFGERPLVAAFWQVRDPGNAGTVIRAADAAGCDAVILLDDCVDVFNPKVIRSTAGSLFHIPVVAMDVAAFFSWTGDNGLATVAADVYGVDGKAPVELPQALADRDFIRRSKAVVFGNEARGLEPGLLRRCDSMVRVPLYGKAESLNLATSAAVLLMSLAMSSHIEKM
ncbi:TrmH family RNA methyltransferase [Bifidobacterium leontopitheci]|uniref:rRNA methyltransferase n=1 Tax=Bifidobacterium leontopitheci TaxID=2650774 RepID=A0A6I1GNN6_9BIFI|nr:RNA methyltransferase [Bifidobacterium leontopitheci]KAB7790927.1 rRNA methyltransferase [Bifidobacterium leontopitheci]